MMAKELTPLNQEDYEVIEAAVMETDRGRWFLNEYARRNRTADTTLLLDAIQKLERSIGSAASPQQSQGPQSADAVRMNLVEMIAAIAETRRQISSMGPEQGEDSSFSIAADELAAIVTATENATQSILGAAEQVQECAWHMREAGIADEHCETLDTLVTEIYTACTFQDITGQRISKVVTLLEYLEERLEAMRQIWGGEMAPTDVEALQDIKRRDTRPDAHLLNGPQLEGDGQGQDDIDLIMVDIEDFSFDDVSPATDRTAAVEPTEAEAAPGPGNDSDDDLFADPSSAVPTVAETRIAETAIPEVASPDAAAADDEEEMLFSETDIIEAVLPSADDQPLQAAVTVADAGDDDMDGDIFEDAEPAGTAPSAAQMVSEPDEEESVAETDADDEPEPQLAAIHAAQGDDLAIGDLQALDQDEKLALFS